MSLLGSDGMTYNNMYNSTDFYGRATFHGTLVADQIKDNGLTANTWIGSNSNKMLESRTLQGTANQVNISNIGTVYTLSTPQNIDVSANVEFNSLIVNNFAVNSLNASEWISTDASKNFVCRTLSGTPNQINISNVGEAYTLATPQDIATTSDVTFNTVKLGNGTLTSSATSAKTYTIPNYSGSNFLMSNSDNNIQVINTTSFLALDISGAFPALGSQMAFSYAGARKMFVGWDITNGCKIFDNANGSFWLYQGGTTTGAIRTLNNILDNGSGNMTIAGTTTLSALTASLPLKLNGSKQITSTQLSLTSDVTGILPVANGGTNSSTSLTNGKIMVSSAGSIIEGTSSTTPTFTTVNTTGLNVSGTINMSALTASTPLKLNGSKNVITSAIDLSSSDVTGVLPIANGGTNSSSALTNGKLMVSSAGTIIEGTSSTTPTFTTVNATGLNISGTTNMSSLTASTPLKLNGSKNVVTSAIDLSSSDVTGVLPVANGGTGGATMVTSITGTANQVIASASTGAVTLSLPQSIATSSNVEFGTLGLGVAAGTNGLDVLYAAARTGSHATSRPLYVTGNIGADNTGVEFRHYNGTQGIGFGYNTIYATGSNTNQDLGLLAKGSASIIAKINGSTSSSSVLIVDNATTSATTNGIDMRLNNTSKAVIKYDTTNGIQIVDTANSTTWLSQGGTNKKVITGNTNVLDDGAGNMAIQGTKTFEFGQGTASKESNAGKIGYGTFDSGASLNIVGAGASSPGNTRLVRIWDYMAIGTGPSSSYSLDTASHIRCGGSLYLPTSGGTPSPLNFYEVYDYATNITGGFTTVTNGHVYITRIGFMVNVIIKAMTTTATSSSTISLSTALPARFSPFSNVSQPIRIIDNSTYYCTGLVQVVAATGVISMYVDAAGNGFNPSGTVGWPDAISITFQTT